MTVFVVDGTPKRLLQSSSGSTLAPPVDRFRALSQMLVQQAVELQFARIGAILDMYFHVIAARATASVQLDIDAEGDGNSWSLMEATRGRSAAICVVRCDGRRGNLSDRAGPVSDACHSGMSMIVRQRPSMTAR